MPVRRLVGADLRGDDRELEGNADARACDASMKSRSVFERIASFQPRAARLVRATRAPRGRRRQLGQRAAPSASSSPVGRAERRASPRSSPRGSCASPSACERRLELVVAGEQRVGAFLAEDARELAADAAVPVDQRAVAVERRPPVGHGGELSETVCAARRASPSGRRPPPGARAPRRASRTRRPAASSARRTRRRRSRPTRAARRTCQALRRSTASPSRRIGIAQMRSSRSSATSASSSPRCTASCSADSVCERRSVGASSSCSAATSISSLARWRTAPQSTTNLATGPHATRSTIAADADRGRAPARRCVARRRAARRARSRRRRSKVSTFALKSKLFGRPFDETLVTPTGGGDGQGAARLPARLRRHAERHAQPRLRLGAAPARATARRSSLLPEGDIGWWHDRKEGDVGLVRPRRGDPRGARRAAARTSDRVAIGGISMGGFGALDLGRLHRSVLRGRRPLAGRLRARFGRHLLRRSTTRPTSRGTT